MDPKDTPPNQMLAGAASLASSAGRGRRAEGGASPKEAVRQMIDRLPDDVSLEEIQYHIYVRQKVARGLRDVEEGKTLSQTEVEERMKKWL